MKIDWSPVSTFLEHAGATVTSFAARGGELLGWPTWAFGAAALGVLVGGVALLGLMFWPSRRTPKVRRGSSRWTRRHEVGRLARAGETVPMIARETRLAQDAVRSLIAAR